MQCRAFLQSTYHILYQHVLSHSCNPGEHLPPKHNLPPLVIGIDPDGSGALAAVQVQSLPQPDAQVIQDVDIELHDNPVEIFQSATRKRR